MLCPNNCNNKGKCIKGVCQCEVGYRDETCNTRYVVHGLIFGDKVICDKGWTGPICNEKTCDECLNGSECKDGVCLCKKGWKGNNCGHKACINDCSFNGVCVSGKCKCTPGFTGKYIKYSY